MVLKDIREHQKWERASFLRSEVSGGLTQFLRYYSTLFPSVRISGNHLIFLRFQELNILVNIFLWNVIIPLKISLQKSYGTLGFQRTKVTPLRDTAKFQKNTGGHADHNFSVSPPSPTTYSPGAWSKENIRGICQCYLRRLAPAMSSDFLSYL